MTVRQVFYQAEVRGLAEKAETGYAKVQRGLLVLRTERVVPFSWIVDHTRWQRKPRTHDSIEQALQDAYSSYRKTVWSSLNSRIEVWCEKDALAGVLVPVTSEYDVPLLVAHGYSSTTFTHSAAEAIAQDAERGITTYVYHLGDYDLSGQDTALDIEAKLREYAPAAPFVFEQVAVTPEQIREYQLPTRPTKQTDTRAKGFNAISVELDALPPDVLRALVRAAIEEHLPDGYMANLRLVEEEEPRLFARLLRDL